MIRLPDKLTMLANARFRLLMDRRKREGKSTIGPATMRAVVSALVNRSDQDGVCYPSLERLGDESDTSPRTVQRVCEILREEQVVSVTVRQHLQGVPKADTTNQYRIHWDALRECAPDGVLTRTDDNLTSVPTDDAAEDCGQSDVRTDDSLSSETDRTDVNCAQNCRQLDLSLRKEPPNEPEPPQTPPQGGPSRSLRSIAEQIQASAWSHAHGAFERDVTAIMDAITGERDREGGLSADAITASVRAYAKLVRRGLIEEPPTVRRWMKDRTFALQEDDWLSARSLGLVQNERRRDREIKKRQADRAAEQRREAENDQQQQIANEIFARLQPETVDAVIEILKERDPSAFRWGPSDPKQSRFIRRDVVEHLLAHAAGRVDGLDVANITLESLTQENIDAITRAVDRGTDS